MLNFCFFIPVLAKFEFRTEFLKWIKTLPLHQESCVTDDGISSKYLKLKRSALLIFYFQIYVYLSRKSRYLSIAKLTGHINEINSLKWDFGKIKRWKKEKRAYQKVAKYLNVDQNQLIISLYLQLSKGKENRTLFSFFFVLHLFSHLFSFILTFMIILIPYSYFLFHLCWLTLSCKVLKPSKECCWK